MEKDDDVEKVKKTDKKKDKKDDKKKGKKVKNSAIAKGKSTANNIIIKIDNSKGNKDKDKDKADKLKNKEPSPPNYDHHKNTSKTMGNWGQYPMSSSLAPPPPPAIPAARPGLDYQAFARDYNAPAFL